jgi:hypothetical protein
MVVSGKTEDLPLPILGATLASPKPITQASKLTVTLGQLALAYVNG